MTVWKSAADQCRERGIQVGDIIEGRQTGPGTWWEETRLRLLWLGTEIAVWDCQTRTVDRQQWDLPKETASWVLDYRQWKKI